MRVVSRTVPAPAHLGVEVLGVPEGSPLELDLRLESVVEGVLVSGTVSGTASGECVRCLDPLTASVVVDLQELYAYPGARPGPEPDEESDTEPLAEMAGDLVDIEPAVRDAVVLALPLQPLCRDDCPGLCPQCGARLADEPGHAHEVVDQRWAALRGLATGTEHDRTS